MATDMRDEYDFSKASPNPYIGPKQQITIRLDQTSVEYFKQLADETGIPYQSLINLYLRDCVKAGRKPDLSWRA